LNVKLVGASRNQKVKLTLACIYRSPEGDCYEFLKKFELAICKAKSKGKQLILCGEWNINFLQDSAKLQELQNVFFLIDKYCEVNNQGYK
jgi:exonuclease III